MTELVVLRLQRHSISLTQCEFPVALQLDCPRRSLVLLNGPRYTSLIKEFPR